MTKGKARALGDGCVGSGISRRELRKLRFKHFRRTGDFMQGKTCGRPLDLKHGADPSDGKLSGKESEIRFAVTGLVSSASDRLAVSIPTA
jgi:hypothetical protein